MIQSWLGLRVNRQKKKNDAVKSWATSIEVTPSEMEAKLRSLMP
jgi:hypothetical protein